MPVFTSIGVALGAAAGSTAAFATGLGVTALAGAGAYAAGAALSGKAESPSIVSRLTDTVTETGALSEAEAQTAAKKRAFRSGVLFTSPTGLDSDPRTSSAKLR